MARVSTKLQIVGQTGYHCIKKIVTFGHSCYMFSEVLRIVKTILSGLLADPLMFKIFEFVAFPCGALYVRYFLAKLPRARGRVPFGPGSPCVSI